MPGYTEQRFAATYWPPLPAHALQGKGAAELLSDEDATRRPLGWGPYRIVEWTAGDHITFEKNPLYFRAAEGLPKFEHLVYRFLGNPADSALEALVAGECDIVDRNPGFQPDLEELVITENSGRLKMLLQLGPEWEMLAFGVRPAVYDDGYQPGEDRADFFGDPRMRKAVAQCIDRPALVQEFFFNRSAVPGGTLPPVHPLYQAEIQPLAYDPAAANALLDEIGWRDLDGDPATPRTAAGVMGVVDGTPLQLVAPDHPGVAAPADRPAPEQRCCSTAASRPRRSTSTRGRCSRPARKARCLGAASTWPSSPGRRARGPAARCSPAPRSRLRPTCGPGPT